MDDSKNKRYFKDDIEDLSMFFLVNGKEVINYMGFGYSDIKDTVKLLVNEAKIPILASILLGVVTFSILNITLVNHEGYETEVSVSDTTVIDEEGANITEDVPPLTMKEIKELIYASPNLTQKQKEYLYNPEDIANVLHYVSPTRYEELRFRYTGLELQYIPEEEKKKYQQLGGYYDSSRFPHTLFLPDDSDYTFIGAAPHEKKHLDQANYNYPFIIEACAEIEAAEFWGGRATTYLSARSRVSFLMEMIGPRPILECTYNYDDSSLVAEINRYLDEDDANKLLNEFKELIYLNIKDYNYSEELKELLTGDKHFNDFTKEEIKRIMNFDVPDGNRERYNRYCYHLTNYLFVLDGLGVIQYLKEAYGDNLPIEMLKRSNVCTSAFYYSGYGVDYSILGERHLFSLYRKFVKYYPDKIEEFIKLVNGIDLLTATEFVNNYMKFVRNGLNSDFIFEKGNISINGLDCDKRDSLGLISAFSLFGNRGSGDDEFDKKWDKRSNDIIKRDFEKLVNSYNEEKGYEKKLTMKQKID